MKTDGEKAYRARTGEVITDADIEALADEAERGYDVVVLRAKGRGRPLLGSAPGEVVPVRLDPELRRAVQACALAEGTSNSEIIRRALRRYVEAT